MAHPLAAGKSSGVMGIVGEVLAAKSGGEAAQIEKLIAHYGPPKEQAISKFAAEIQGAAGKLRGDMAKISGAPVNLVDDAWRKAIDSGHAATLLQYAAMAGSKGGAASAAAGD
jgi:hypothetical protein